MQDKSATVGKQGANIPRGVNVLVLRQEKFFISDDEILVRLTFPTLHTVVSAKAGSKEANLRPELDSAELVEVRSRIGIPVIVPGCRD